MFPNTRQLCPRDEHLSRRSRLGWHRASRSETRGNESAFTRVFDALCPRVTAENGLALSQFEQDTLLVALHHLVGNDEIPFARQDAALGGLARVVVPKLLDV